CRFPFRRTPRSARGSRFRRGSSGKWGLGSGGWGKCDSLWQVALGLAGRPFPMHSISRRSGLMVALAGSLLASAAPVFAQVRLAQGDGPVAPPVSRTLVAVHATVDGKDVVRSARRFIGVPYRLG